MKWLLNVFVLTMLVSQTKAKIPVAAMENLHRFVNATMECRNTLGLTMTMVKSGQTILARGYGFQDLEKRKPMENTTLVNIASISKAFTTTLLAKAVSQRLFHWDTSLMDLIPSFAMMGRDNIRTKYANIRDVVSHRTGLPSYWGVSTSCLNVSREDLVRRIQYWPVLYWFRSAYLYCNYGYVMAARALEEVTNKTWEQHMKDTIFIPLGMSHSKTSGELTEDDWQNRVSFSHTQMDSVDRTLSTNQDHVQLPFLTEIGPSAGVFSNAVDMAKWMKFHLRRNGRLENGTELIPWRYLRRIYLRSHYLPTPSWSIQKPEFPVDDVSFTYAYGWINGMYRGHEKIRHTGVYSSYRCRLTLLPESDVGVWVCVNSPGSAGGRVAHLVSMYALDTLLDNEQPWLNETTGCTFPSPWRSVNSMEDPDTTEEEEEAGNLSVAVPADSINTISIPEIGTPYIRDTHLYIGEYHHPGFGTFYIDQSENNTLHARFGRFLRADIWTLRSEPQRDHLYFTLKQPLFYRMAQRLPTPPLTFRNLAMVDGIQRYTQLSAAILEPRLPPVFTRDIQQSTTEQSTVKTPDPVRSSGDVITSFKAIIVLCFIIHNQLLLG